MQLNYVPSALPHRKRFCARLPPNLAVLGLTTPKKVFFASLQLITLILALSLSLSLSY